SIPEPPRRHHESVKGDANLLPGRPASKEPELPHVLLVSGRQEASATPETQAYCLSQVACNCTRGEGSATGCGTLAPRPARGPGGRGGAAPRGAGVRVVRRERPRPRRPAVDAAGPRLRSRLPVPRQPGTAL